MDSMSRRPVPIYRRGNRPLVRGGQGRSDDEVAECGFWFAAFCFVGMALLMVCLWLLAGGVW